MAASHNELLIAVMSALGDAVHAATDIEEFNSAEVRRAVEVGDPEVPKQVTLQPITRCAMEDGSDGGVGTCAQPRRYLQIKVETDAAGLFGMPTQHLEASAYVRLP